MARVYTYSFEDTTIEISHPNYGAYSAFGTGIGTVQIQYAQDITTHDVASDLATVVSKHAYVNGTVVLDILQSSDFNAWLKGFTNFVSSPGTSSSDFATAELTIRNKSTGDTYVCKGVSPQKRADNNFQSDAQRRSWTLMCAEIVEV